ncbi:MAG: TAXI family TRAP transporter solute-binding subunit [Clostridia bacterium]|nr:TAXI family TRAP transporter solute-binding subunit [Clostridia bacterium]
MKKRFVTTLLSLVLALSLVIPATALAELTFTTGGTSGTYYAFGNVLAQYVTNNSDVAVTAVAGNGSAANIDLLDIGDAQLALVQNDVASYAYNGTRFEQYEGNPITSFTALAALYTETVQLITCNPEIKSVADLKGKNVSIGSAGSGVYFNALDFFAAYDMTLDDINPQYLSFGDSAESLKDGKIDAAFVVAGAPTPAVTDLCTTKGAYLVALDDEHVAKLQEISGAYAKSIIPAGTYEGVDEDTVTVGIKATIIANEDVTEDEAYTIVSTIFENAPAITEAHAKGAELDLEYAATCGLPYHAGAAKYFAEKGFTVETAE